MYSNKTLSGWLIFAFIIFLCLQAGLPVFAQVPVADTVFIPEAVKVNRERAVVLPLIEKQFSLAALAQGSQETIFEAPPCIDGNYYIGFQLYYDLGDRQTLVDWTSVLTFSFLHDTDTLWKNALQVSMSSQTFIATTFHDVPVSCDAGYTFYVNAKTLTGAVPEDHIYLKILLYKAQEEEFDPAAALQLNYALTGQQVVTSWSYAGASVQAYDVEWVFIDDHDNFSGTAEEAFAFKRPVRVTTAGAAYQHDVYYPDGRIWCRARAVGYAPQYPKHRIPGQWFYGDGAALTIVNHQPDKNWQLQTAFAEAGKYKHSMAYFDGSSRQRQLLTNLSTETLVMLTEALYDYEGRECAQVLAVPATANALSYQSGFHLFETVDADVAAHTSAVHQKFHYDNYRLAGSVLSDQVGAGKYYSPANDIGGLHADYIPDAGGYVYTQTEFMRDGTGRVTRQGGVGEAFRIDGAHAVRNYYGEAAPAELIRLFGSSAGVASHYKKNLVVDANGQVTVSYIDQRGQVVASALAGDKPDHVAGLESYNTLATDLITVDLTGKNSVAQGVSETSHKILNVNPNTDYTFQYNLTTYGASLAAMGCQTCAFDLIMTLTDTEGDFMDLSAAAGNEAPSGYRYERYNITTADCVNSLTGVVAFTVTLPEIGDYTLTKTLIPHELSIADLQNLVFQDASFLTELQVLYESYEIDSAACEVCTDCPAADSLIDQTIQELASLDCENIYQQIIQHYRDLYGDASEDPYEVPQDSITSHPLYCQYELCIKDQESSVFERQIARITDWPTAVAEGYTALADLDPFFNNSALSGAGHKGTIENKLSSIIVGTIQYDSDQDGTADGATIYLGTLLNVTNPANTAYYIDAYGNADPTGGYHMLYYDLMSRKGQMTTAGYEAALNQQRWTLYKSYYLEAKRKTQLEIAAYQNCDAARAALERTDNLPLTSEGIALWAEDQGVMPPVCDEELEMAVSNLAFNCQAQFSEADSLLIIDHLEDYFNENPHNIFRLILTEDLGINPHLIAIENIMARYGCSLVTVALDDPITCVDASDNWIVNPTLEASSSSCGVDITAACYPGWVAATGTPNTDPGGGSGRVFIWAYPGTNTSEAIRGSFVEPLEPGVKYELCLSYKVGQDDAIYTDGVMDHVYFQLSRSNQFTNASGTTITTAAAEPYTAAASASATATAMRLATDSLTSALRLARLTTAAAVANCILPGARYPDPVTIGDETTAVENVWSDTNLTNVDDYRDTCIVFVPTEASTYCYLSAMSCTTGSYQGISVRNMVVRKILPRNPTITFEGETVCVEYDTTNSTLKAFSYVPDWEHEVNECLERAAAENAQLIDYATEQLIEEYVSNLYNLYNTQCLAGVQETLTYSYLPKEYHYTLYYYDQAANLVQTVPPQGVHPLTPAQVDAFLAGHTTEPAHTMVTTYQFSSTNKIIQQQSPDAGHTQFWYNAFGQLRLTQDARQFLENHYTYTKYDAQGRAIETGEMTYTASVPALQAALETPDFPEASTYRLHDIACTHYDLPYADTLNGFVQENLRTRVSYVEIIEAQSADTVMTFYSYDIHGNVRALLQRLPGMAPKRVDYQYDLVSGHVNYVFYQYNASDQLTHRYRYDADDRITEVATSSDRFIWHQEAAYGYYRHGGLAREERGAYRVQATDYVYTLQGWIKSVNMPYAGDPGQDGVNGSAVGKDVFAYTLGYYDQDYQASNASVAMPDGRDQLWTRLQAVMGHNGLHNANISWMVTDLSGLRPGDAAGGMQAMAYQYDQLHRLVKGRSFTTYTEAGGFATRTAGPQAYDTDYSYDANGNLLTLQRRDGQGDLMDDFQYQYYRGTNRLKEVMPVARDTVYRAGSIVTNYKIYRNITIEETAQVLAGSTVRLNASENFHISPNFRAHQNADFYAHVLEEDEGTFVYDASGNLIADQDKGLRTSWTSFGKIREVRAKIDSVIIHFRYDAMGNRIEKRMVRADTTYAIRYVRDAMGMVMAVYYDTTLHEQHLYGKSRLGVRVGGSKAGTLVNGGRHYEMTNHLGNVLAVITDEVGMAQDSVWAHVITYNDYYPFGLIMAGRVRGDTTVQYRYGFGGHERDDEIAGPGNHLAFEDYGYDPRLARRWNVDPRFQEIAGISPYTYALNNPLVYIDQDGQLPIVPLLLKAGVAGAADMLMQATMAYFFDPEVETYEQALDKVDWVLVGKSAAEGMIPWRIPGGKLGKAAATAITDVALNAARAGTDYSVEQAFMDFAVGFIGDLAGEGLGELLAKYGSKAIGRGLSKMGFDDKMIEDFLTGKATTWKGSATYSDLDATDAWARTRGAGKEFTRSQKIKIRARNREWNNGYLRDDQTGDFLTDPKQDLLATPSDMKSAQVDHKQARKNRTRRGTNHYSNAQVISKQRNIKKSNY